MNNTSTAFGEALNEAIEASPDAICWDKTRMLDAWEKCKDHYGKELQQVPAVAHREVLEGDWLINNSRKHTRIVNNLRKKGPEMNIETMVGKLSLKLAGIKFDDDMDNFDKAQVRYNEAAIVDEVLIDNDEVIVRVDRQKGRGKQKHTIICFDPDTPKEPVDLFKGACSKPAEDEFLQTHVGHQRLPAIHKWMLRQISSWEWRLSDYCSDELVLRGYQLSAEYNSHSDKELSAHRHDRHDNDYINAVEELRQRGVFYLPMFFDHRGRLCYYFARVFGVRPGGKLWETAMIDRAKPKLLTESAVNHLKHVIYTFLHGKYSLEHAVKHFKDKDYQTARDISPLDVEVPDVPYGMRGENARVYKAAESEFGKRIILNKAADALDLYNAGLPCAYIFGKDLTNSGLIMAGNCFRSEKMLRGANMWGLKTVADSHNQFGKAHNILHLPRDEIKDIHTPLLHGSSVLTIVEKLHEHVPDPENYSEDSVYDSNIEAYGHEVNNIEIIAGWGAEVVTAHQNVLKWKTPDEFPACHKAMMDRVPFNVYAASTRVREGDVPCKEYKLMATMPLSLGADGRCTFGKANTTPLSDKGVAVRTRGLYADITHSIDGTLLRRIIMWLLSHDEQGLFKHDDYMVSPDMFDGLTNVAQGFFEFLSENNLYSMALEQVATTLKKVTKAPKLFVGRAVSKVRESFNFLMA